MLKRVILLLISLAIAPFAFSGSANAANPGADYSEIMALQSKEADKLFLLDVRTPHEYEVGHLVGSVSAPGGQLVQATDEYVATRGARLGANS